MTDGRQLQPCEIAVTDTVVSQSRPALRFSCGGEFAATAIQGSEDWLVFFSPPEEGQRGQESVAVGVVGDRQRHAPRFPSELPSSALVSSHYLSFAGDAAPPH